MSGYITGQTEIGPKPGGGTLTQSLNPFQYATRAAANLLAALFGGTVSGGDKQTNSGPIKLPDSPLTVDVGGTSYQAGALEALVNAYGASRTADLINSGFVGQKPATPLQVHPLGQNISTAPANQHTPWVIDAVPVAYGAGYGGTPPAYSYTGLSATHTPAVPVAPAPVFSTQPVQHVESVSHPAVNILPARHYAPTTDLNGKIIA